MAIIRGQSYSVQIVAWDLSANPPAPKTGDASNITVRISKDGGALQATTNSPVEVSATHAPGCYRVVLTASEMDANTIEVYAKSSTSGVYCPPIQILTDRGRVDVAVSTRATAQSVWEYSARTLTSFGTLVADIWSYSTRTLTSFGSLVSDVATAVWAHSTRTLTSFGTLVSDVGAAVWSYTIEASQSALSWMRLMGATLFGKRVVSGGTESYRDWNDTKNRVVGSVDDSGNRTVTSRDGS